MLYYVFLQYVLCHKLNWVSILNYNLKRENDIRFHDLNVVLYTFVFFLINFSFKY
ncbi:hypothetical protein HanIR_Chr06g0292371 [Helianthus annuus]|nr:hypothetical protein HanIR_Chr06g0292371 [Helianthus annuus]